MANEAYYTKHDENARNDPKIRSMRAVYGAEGYGLFWMFIESMRSQPNYKLPISGKYALTGYAQDFGVDIDKLTQYIDDCVSEFTDNNGGLFKRDQNYLWSESLLRRMQAYNAKCAVNQQTAMQAWKDRKAAQAKAQPAPGPAPKAPEKPKLIKKTYGEFKNVFLTDEDYNKLVSRFGEDQTKAKIEGLSSGIKSHGYKYKDFYSTILNWDKRDNKSQNKEPVAAVEGSTGAKIVR